jgi:hypothetical protein
VRAVLFAALVVGAPALLAAATPSTQEVAIDVRAWYGAVGGAKPDLTASNVIVEILDATSGTRYATDDPATAAFVCRSGNASDVCVPPGGDAFDPSEQNRAFATLQPGEWTDGDELDVTIHYPANATTGTSTVTLHEGGIALDVVLIQPPDSISLTVLPGARSIAPDATATYTVRVENHRPFTDTIGLALASATPAGWTVTLGAPSATLPPGGVYSTSLLVHSPPVDQVPYALLRNPARLLTSVRATPENATALARSATAITSVPLVVRVENLTAPRGFLVLSQCSSVLTTPSNCYPDPTQAIGFDVRASFIDDAPAAGANVSMAIYYYSPDATSFLIPSSTTRDWATTDAAGRVHFEVPFGQFLGLPLHPLGQYLLFPSVTLYDLAGSTQKAIMVGPVAAR